MQSDGRQLGMRGREEGREEGGFECVASSNPPPTRGRQRMRTGHFLARTMGSLTYIFAPPVDEKSLGHWIQSMDHHKDALKQ